MPLVIQLHHFSHSETGEHMNRHQQAAIDHHCRLSVETMHPKFARVLPGGMSAVLTVNSGYE